MTFVKLIGDGIFINPAITHSSAFRQDKLEGCLSWEEGTREIQVRRPSTCTVSAFDRRGKHFKMKLSGWAARCVQHEIDHLNGINIADKLKGV